jgi:hypothetical protein
MADELPLAIIDLNGVVADVRHRLHHVQGRRKDWTAFFAAASEDPVHPEGRAVVQTLAREHEVVFLTGRPAHLHDDTVRWLERHGFGGHRVVMRRNGDRRPAAIAKAEMIAAVAAGRTVGIVVDDDAAVLDAMRRAGHPTFAADWEARDAEAEQAITAAQEADGRT